MGVFVLNTRWERLKGEKGRRVKILQLDREPRQRRERRGRWRNA